MANYQRSKIRVYPQSGTIDRSVLVSRVQQLKVENNIYESIFIFYEKNGKFAEIRFTAKRFPTMIEEIFPLSKYDLWIISSNEGGNSDYLRYHTKDKSLFGGFLEKAIYSFDQIVLYGNAEKLLAESQNIFGFGGRDINKHTFEHGINVALQGLYTANNFFYGEEEDQIKPASLEKAPIGKLLNDTGEFWGMIFHTDGIKFLENFYKKNSHAANGINHFPYIEKIEFYDKNRLSNRLEWTATSGGPKYWKHFSDDGFHNCNNAKFFTYKTLHY